MTIVRLNPAALSLLLLAAHFLRSGDLFLVVLALAVVGLLMVRRPWAGTVVQWVLLVGALEWLRTTAVLVDERRLAGLPYTRMAVILVTVGAFTLASAAMVRTERVAHYFARARAGRRLE
jgi:hypothetical protein